MHPRHHTAPGASSSSRLRIQVSKPASKDPKEAPGAATPAKNAPPDKATPLEGSQEGPSLPPVANLLQFVAWVVAGNQATGNMAQLEGLGALVSQTSGLRKGRRFLASQLSPIQEAAIRCQVRCQSAWGCAQALGGGAWGRRSWPGGGVQLGTLRMDGQLNAPQLLLGIRLAVISAW